jgi:hypothetical protein
VPPINKQVKTKENKEKKTVKAVALALLLIVALAAFVEAQQNGTRPGGNMTNVDQALGGFKDIAKWVVLGVRTAIAMAFWVAFGIVVAHFALGKVSPTRFQRMGSFWDGLERAKDIIYGYAWLFLLILAIYTVIGLIASDGQIGPNTVGQVVKWMMVDPLVDLYNELQGGQGGQGTGQRPGG